MVSLNQIVSRIQAIADQHYQVKSFDSGNVSQAFEKDSLDRLLYPRVFLNQLGATSTGGSLYYNFELIITDLVDKDRGNEQEVKSDCMQIATDFITVMERFEFINEGSDAFFQPSQTVNYGFLSEDYSDRISGVVANIQIKQGFNFNRCVVPISSNINCGSSPSCTDTINDLGADYYDCVLPSYDFTTSRVQNAVTAQQQTDLTTWLCTGGGDVEIYDTDNNLLYTVTAPDSQTITNSTAVLKDTDANTLSTTSILAQGSQDITAPDGNIQLNSVAMTTVLSGGTENIQVRQSSGSTQVGSKQGQYWRIADADIENSDQSYTSTVKAEGTLVLPDIDFTDSDGTTTSVPSVQNIVATPCTPQKNIASHIKTGQTTSYRTNDDGDLQRGRETDFTTLSSNNPFGNTNRFTDDGGGQTYTSDWVIDWAFCNYVSETVIGWYRVEQSTTNFAGAMTGQPYNLGGYSDCYVPNVTELMSICDHETNVALNYSPFSLSNNYWSSTTAPNNTNNAKIAGSSGIGNVAKTNSGVNYIVMRIFTFAELGL